MVTEESIREAFIFLRVSNNTIPDETLNFMLKSSMEKLKETSNHYFQSEEVYPENSYKD